MSRMQLSVLRFEYVLSGWFDAELLMETTLTIYVICIWDPYCIGSCTSNVQRRETTFVQM